MFTDDLMMQLSKDEAEEHAWYNAQEDKVGEYDNPKDGCPNCSRFRVMIGDDKKHRCEKCYYCIEDREIDLDFAKKLLII